MASFASRILSRRNLPAAFVARQPVNSLEKKRIMRAPPPRQSALSSRLHSTCLDSNITGCDCNNSTTSRRLFTTDNDKSTTIADSILDNVTVIPGTGAKSGQKQLAIVFTCTVCNTRSAKQFTEQAYRHGVVLVKCPGCQNLHLIADRLGVFENQGMDGKGWDIEQFMAKMGENVKAVNKDNVLELTVDDIVGSEKMKEILDNKDKGENEKS